MRTRLNVLRVRHMRGAISTDDILPARYKHRQVDPATFAPHIFEAYSPGWAETVRPGDVLVTNDIFGIGSSREQAVTALLAAGIAAVIAPAFDTIFFRNAWNNSLPALEVKMSEVAEGEEIGLDLPAGRLLTTQGVVQFQQPPQVLLDAVEAGGLLAAVKARLNSDGTRLNTR